MLESFNGNTFEYQKLSPEEQQRRGILGRLKGIIADYKNPTRNGRLYGSNLWDKVFDNPVMQEKIANRCVFGELCHPMDGRTEVDPEKIAICLAEQPKKDNQGHLVGIFDILDTPCGKILKTMMDYGTTMGISSRGTGDTFTNNRGQEEVDPDTYDCVGWDAVFVPSVKAARLESVNESLEQPKLSLRQALTESINKASDKDKKIMQEVIKDLNLNESLKGSTLTVIYKDKDGDEDTYYFECDKDYDLNSEQLKQAIKTSNNNIAEIVNISESLKENNTNNLVKETMQELYKEDVEVDLPKEEQDNQVSQDDNESSNDVDIDAETKTEEDGDAESDGVEALQDALEENLNLTSKNRELQEKLSVCYAKEAKQLEAINSYQKAISSLTERVKKITAMQSEVNSLNEKLDSSKKEINELSEKLNAANREIKSIKNKKVSLSESLNQKTVELNNEKVSYNKLNESLNLLKEGFENEKKQLNEQILDLKKDSQIKSKEYTKKIAQSNKLVENYRKIAATSLDKYIESQAKIIGVTSNEIKHKLGEHYSFNDIDRICEDLQQYKLNVSKLPFDLYSGIQSNRARFVESKQPSLTTNEGDEIDDNLLRMVGLKQ